MPRSMEDVLIDRCFDLRERVKAERARADRLERKLSELRDDVMVAIGAIDSVEERTGDKAATFAAHHLREAIERARS